MVMTWLLPYKIYMAIPKSTNWTKPYEKGKKEIHIKR